MELLEQYLMQALAVLAPFASGGLLVAAALVAVSRVPLLSIVSAVVTCGFVATLLASIENAEIAMAVALAGGVAGGVLLLSGRATWLWRVQRPDHPPQSLLFRLAAAAIIALAAQGLAGRVPLSGGAETARLVLWLGGMGLFAALSDGALSAGAGLVVVLAASTLLVPDIMPDALQRPPIYGAIAVLMVAAGLAFSFAAAVGSRGTASRVHVAGRAETTDASAVSERAEPVLEQQPEQRC